MNTLRLVSLLCGGLWFLLLTGCEIVTEQQPQPVLRPARSLVINEVFIQAPPNQNPYYWIELYNPTGRNIDITGWELRFKTTRSFVGFRDSIPNPASFAYIIADPTPHYYDVSFQPKYIYDTIGVNRSTRLSCGGFIEPYSFITIVSNESRMLTYTEWGHGNGIRLVTSEIPTEFHYFFRADTFAGTMGDSIVITQLDTLVLTLYQFELPTSGQFILKDSAGAAMDVFRYGNYVYDDFGEAPTDPYPGNTSLGAIIPYQSYARYFGAYTSGSGGDAAQGNCAADFYITGQPPRENTNPIPQWLSQAYKR